jgi:hypothetical protein
MVNCQASGGSQCSGESITSGPSGHLIVAGNVADQTTLLTYIVHNLIDASGNLVWHHLIEMPPSKPIKTEYVGTSIISLLESSSSNPLMIVKLDVSGTSSPSAYTLHEFGTSSIYNILGAYISSSLVLIGTNSGGVGTLFKVDLSALTYAELSLPSSFSIQEVQFPNPTSDDLDFVYVGSVSSATDGIQSLSYTSPTGFLMNSKALDTCISFTHSWSTPSASLTDVTATYPNSVSTVPSLSGWSLESAPLPDFVLFCETTDVQINATYTINVVCNYTSLRTYSKMVSDGTMD